MRQQSAPTLPEIHVAHREQVRAHYDRIASELDRFRQRHGYYHREIDRYYQFLVLREARCSRSAAARATHWQRSARHAASASISART